MKLADYAIYRMNQFSDSDDHRQITIRFKSPTYIKHEGAMISTLSPEAFVAALVRRYSYRHDQHTTLHGMEGEAILGDVSNDMLKLLLCGELVHIGKNTSFGFGRYRIK